MPGPSSARRFGFHPAAGIEYLREIGYHAAEDHDLGVRFEAEVTHAIERVLEHPEIGRVIREDEGVHFRKSQVQRFRFSVIYVVIRDEVRIYAVAHHSRRTDYWLNRIKS